MANDWDDALIAGGGSGSGFSGKRVNIGLIGTGGIAQGVHLPAYKKLEAEGKVKIVALCDIDEKKLAEANAKFGPAQTFTDYKDLLALEEIDAIDVCTPNYMHMPPVVAAFEAGKNVICEKPIAIDGKQGALMVAGKFGDIYYARAQALRRRGVPMWGVFTEKDKQGGGPLIDIGVHILDMSLWLMGHPKVASVTGSAVTKYGHRSGHVNLFGRPWDPDNFTVEDFASGYVRFANGATLVLEASFILNNDKERFETSLYGTEGGVFLDLHNDANIRIFREEDGTLTDTTPVFLPRIGSHEQEIREFVQAISEDTPVPVPGEQGLMASQILDALYESSETGKTVDF
jgi:predicted dehydrogenase